MNDSATSTLSVNPARPKRRGSRGRTYTKTVSGVGTLRFRPAQPDAGDNDDRCIEILRLVGESCGVNLMPDEDEVTDFEQMEVSPCVKQPA